MKKLACALPIWLIAFATNTVAQTYPERTVRIIVPFPAGGTVDTVARTVAQKLSESLKQPVVVENRAGGAGAIGSDAVAKAAPDGYTLLIGTASTHGANSAVQKSLPYDPSRDFAPIALVGSTPYILVVHAAVPAFTVNEFVSLARAQPGRLNYGSYGNGSSNHLATELLRSIANVEVVHVPYKGGAPALVALLSGEVQMMLDVFTTSAAHIKSGKLRLLGVGSAKRSALAPDIPTLAEAGVPRFEAATYFGLFAPAATPRAIVDRLNVDVNRAITAPEVRERFNAVGTEPGGGAPDVLGQAVAAEVAKWRKLVADRNLKFD